MAKALLPAEELPGGLPPDRSLANLKDNTGEVVANRGRVRDRLRVVGEPFPEGDERLFDLDGRHFVDEDSPIQPLFEALATQLDKEEGKARLERIYRKVAGAPHLRLLLPALIKEIEFRRREGMPWKEVTDHLHLRVPLDGHALILADENGFTALLTDMIDGEIGQNIETAAGVVRTSTGIINQTNARLVEPMMGDAALMLVKSAAQKVAVQEALAANPAPMTVEHLAGKKDEFGEDKYPLVDGRRVFTRSVGIYPIGEDALHLVAYAGKGNRKGGIMVVGEARDKVTQLQKDAGPGETLDATEGWTDLRDIVGPDNIDDLPMPKSPWVMLKTMEAVLQMTPYVRSSIPRLLDEGEEDLESLVTPSLDAYYVVLELEGGDVENFWAHLVEEGTGSEKIHLFKPEGPRKLHFWTEGVSTPHDFEKEVAGFTRQVARMARAAGAKFKMSRGHEGALQRLPLPGGIQVDATGKSIVDTVRGISCLEGEEDCVWVTESACETLGLVGQRAELTTRYIKGRPFRGIVLKIDAEGNTSIRENLLGREEQIAAVQTFVRSLGANGMALKIRKPVDAVDRGYGESAVLRAGDTFARSELGFKDDQIVYLARGKGLFVDLKRKTGHSKDELMENPQLLTEPVLLFLDAESLSAEDSVDLDRFLSAMLGAPIGLIYTGTYQFRPGAMMGEQYKGRELSAEREVGELTLEEAKTLVFQTRTDLTEADSDRVLQLLRDEWKGKWGKPLVPRLLIHNFARAIYKRGDMLNLTDAIVNRVWIGELSEMMDKAGLNEHQRTLLGAVAEIGFPVTVRELKGILRFASDRMLEVLTQTEPAFLVAEGEGAERRYRVATEQMRNARLIVAKDKQAIHAYLLRNNFLREERPEVSEASMARCDIEFEHALAYAESCKNPRTVELVRRLGRYHASQKGGFAAAYHVYSSFMEALQRHHIPVDAEFLSADILADLVWAFTQTGNTKDLAYVQQLLAAAKVAGIDCPELRWRENFRTKFLSPVDKMDELGAENAMVPVLAELEKFNDFFQTETVDHKELVRCVRLASMFDASAEQEGEANPISRLAFKGASLSRRANAARIMSRLVGILRRQKPEGYEALAVKLSQEALAYKLQILQDLVSIEADLVTTTPDSSFNEELVAETARFVAYVRKYLHGVPNDEEFELTQVNFARAEGILSDLERPLPFAGFDSADVRLNMESIYWESQVTNSEYAVDRTSMMAILDGKESEARGFLNEAVKLGMMPYRYRLTLQVLNWLQTKLRLLKRFPQAGDEAIIARLDSEYQDLSSKSARLLKQLTGENQPDYYVKYFRPLMTGETSWNE